MPKAVYPIQAQFVSKNFLDTRFAAPYGYELQGQIKDKIKECYFRYIAPLEAQGIVEDSSIIQRLNQQYTQNMYVAWTMPMVLHTGVDLNVGSGDTEVISSLNVVAVADGVVTRNTGNFGRCWIGVVEVEHTVTYTSGKSVTFYARYCHLNPNTLPKPGQSVKMGQPIGKFALSRGCWPSAHLHFEIGSQSVNPNVLWGNVAKGVNFNAIYFALVHRRAIRTGSSVPVSHAVMELFGTNQQQFSNPSTRFSNSGTVRGKVDRYGLVDPLPFLKQINCNQELNIIPEERTNYTLDF